MSVMISPNRISPRVIFGAFFSGRNQTLMQVPCMVTHDLYVSWGPMGSTNLRLGGDMNPSIRIPFTSTISGFNGMGFPPAEVEEPVSPKKYS